ncbi:MAG: type 2 lantipeptide synthetase LanM, partial [Thermomicrobiaceae bacterium]|nr:type 2 lantipeptide synthetase LanM [Thermomicrobiaceae bacterium]
GFRAVYKPRPLALDRHFQQLLAWLDERGADPPLRPLALLDRGAYGWVEFVSPAPCATADEVRCFYERQGAYLALLYALEATDFHFENLIAAGEHPVLVDLEALFHPRVPGPAGAEPADPAADALAGSVLRVGLLPQRAWTGGGTEGVDLSGLGAREGQMTPFGVPQWEEAGTDAMRLTRRPVAMPGGRNLPVLDGRPVDAAGYVDAIVAGFAATYRLLQRGRDDLLAAGGPLDWFAADEARVILRPTQTYAALLRESFHPDVLRDGLDRDRLFDRLWQGIDQAPWVGRVVPSERADLARGDIPRFTAHPGARDLWSGGGERVAGFFEASGLELARARLAGLGQDDLARQTWLIRASLATLAPA